MRSSSVWWPARFQPEDDGQVTVLAAYREPASDFWVADLPLSSLPKEPVEELETLYYAQNAATSVRPQTRQARTVYKSQ